MLWFATISTTVTMLMGYIGFDRNRQLVIDRYSGDLVTSTNMLATRFLEAIGSVESDLIVLSHLSQLFVSPQLTSDQNVSSQNVSSQSTNDQGRHGLQVVFIDFINAHPEYLDISYIEYANFGRERVRVNRTEQGTHIVEESVLREKGHFPYVYKSAKLPADSIYYANVNIKQENSSIIAANHPTVRMAVPVYNIDNRPAGVIVISLALNTLFQSLKSEASADAQLYLAGPEGDLLIHPDPKKTFGLDKGHRFTIDQEFPSLSHPTNKQQQNLVINELPEWSKDGYVAAFSRIPLGKSQKNNVYMMGMSLPYSRLAPITSQMLQSSIEIVLVVVICSLLMSIALSRLLARPMRQIIRAIAHSADLSESQKLLPLQRSDEFGTLSRAYDTMVQRIKRQLEALKESETNLNSILEAAPSMIVILDMQGCNVLFMNRQANERLAFDGKKHGIHPLLTPQGTAKGKSILELIRANGGLNAKEICLYDNKGKLLWLMLSAIQVKYRDADTILITCADMTETKENESRITQLAFYDPLTNLPNRRLLIDRLKQAIAAAKRHNTYGAIIFMDLDRFKLLNDTAGHQLGDELLIQAAGRIRSLLRGEDTAARLGGDEFVVVLNCSCATAEEATNEAYLVASRLSQRLNEAYQLSNTVHHCSSSMGISLYPENNLQASDYIQQADTAMYLAKGAGGNTINFFALEMKKSADSRLALEKALRVAIAEQQFTLFYQAQVNVTGEAFAAEALIRWNQPGQGMISPMQFIPVAEEAGLIIQIGEWVLRQACQQIKRWAMQGLSLSHVSVNVSSNQFWQSNFIDQVKSALAEAKIAPEMLMIELTEGILIDDIEDAIEKISQLHELGIAISVDDFGTGYSSLSYLTRLPISQLKIDKSFVRNIPEDKGNAVIAETIITMAQNLGLNVIAEGVETLAQKEFLQSKGCLEYQGFYFSKPVAEQEFLAQWRYRSQGNEPARKAR